MASRGDSCSRSKMRLQNTSLPKSLRGDNVGLSPGEPFFGEVLIGEDFFGDDFLGEAFLGEPLFGEPVLGDPFPSNPSLASSCFRSFLKTREKKKHTFKGKGILHLNLLSKDINRSY